MRNHRFGLVEVGVLVVALLLGGSQAYAGGQDVSGKKLLLQNKLGKEKMVLLSKDALVNAGANGSSADPRCEPDGSGWGGAVLLDDGSNTATLIMTCMADPSSGWTSNGAGTQYKFRFSSLFPNPAGPKVGKVKTGQLKVVSKNLGGFPVPNGAATVNVQMRVGLDKYCMAFPGTGDGSKFLVKDAPAATTCPATPGCTGESVGGACWFIGEAGESCDDTCVSLGKICDPATVTYAGTGGTLSGCAAVVEALVPGASPPGDITALGGYAYGCNAAPSMGVGNPFGPYSTRMLDAPTTCAAAGASVNRICACM